MKQINYTKQLKEKHMLIFFEYIRVNIIPNKKTVPITSLTTMPETEILHDSSRKHIHRKLESELGAAVQIFPGKVVYGS